MHNIESPLTEQHDAKNINLAENQQQTDKQDSVNHYNVLRRNGKLTSFDREKIVVAMTKAFLAVEGGQAAASSRVHETVENMTNLVVDTLKRRQPNGGTFMIEDIQDQVELALMRNGEQKVARSYVLYREEQSKKRASEEPGTAATPTEGESYIHVKMDNGQQEPLDTKRLQRVIADACEGLDNTDPQRVYQDTLRNLFDGVAECDVCPMLVMSARALIDVEPDYSQVAARLLLDSLRTETLTFIKDGNPNATYGEMADRYPAYFAHYLKKATELELIDTELLKFDLPRLGEALNRNVTISSLISVSRPCMIVTSYILLMTPVLNCLKPFLCASPWGLR